VFRKFTLAALATIVGMVAATKLTSGKYTTLSELLNPRTDRPSSVDRVSQTPRSEHQGAKRDRPSFTLLSPTQRGDRGRSVETLPGTLDRGNPAR
jgi:hypothetical protein